MNATYVGRANSNREVYTRAEERMNEGRDQLGTSKSWS